MCHVDNKRSGMPRAIKQIKWKVCENSTRYWRGGRMLQAIWHCGHVVFSVPVVICCILQYTAVMFFILAAWAQANVTVQLRGDTYDSWPCRLSSKTDLPILLFFFFPATQASAFSCSRGVKKKKKHDFLFSRVLFQTWTPASALVCLQLWWNCSSERWS